MNRNTVLMAVALATCPFQVSAIHPVDSADTFHLTDEPGNWFRSETTGIPFTVVSPGDRVDFVIGGCCTNTRHTVTLLLKPEGSAVEMDQDKSQKGSLSVELDIAGVYVFVCKVHPYMTAVVAVQDEDGNIPDVTAGALPFIGHLGAASLPATDVLGVITTVAPTDDDKAAKWDLLGPEDEFEPAVPGVGEVWVDTQFERVPDQTDAAGVPKPGTITVVDSATFEVEREIDGRTAGGMWNNPHNMWANAAHDTIYNTNWFGKWVNKIDRETGEILGSVKVGEAPTHVITIPIPDSPQKGMLTVPLSADKEVVKLEDGPGGLQKIEEHDTGSGENNPHGHWLTCGTGDRAIVPNVFQGLGLAGSISILDTESGAILKEFSHDASDPDLAALLMPLAVGECHVHGVSTAYVANAVSGIVTVIDVDAMEIVASIPVTRTPDGQAGQDLLHTLQVPIQTPVSPDERWVATAVLALTTVPTSSTGSPDHVALIDTSTNQVVKLIPTPAGTHGVNWGPKLGGGYYAWVSNQHANVLTVIDPDPNGDGDGSDGAVVGNILLANGSDGAGATDGTGGQGIKPLPLSHDGWTQQTVAMVGTGELSAEVEGWIALLTPEQRDPSHPHGIHLEVGPYTPGVPLELVVEGAEPGEQPAFVAGFAGIGAGPCFDALGGLCLDLIPPVFLIGTASADASGEALLQVATPPILLEIDVHLQAVIKRGEQGADSVKTEAVTVGI
jgi:DNA-binding beta-propeller fold protein YncE